MTDVTLAAAAGHDGAVAARRRVAGGVLFAAAAAALLLIAAPVVIQGGLLADEYIICLRPVHEGGYGPYLHAIWRDTGVVRPGRFIELFLISKTCTQVPYGFVILVPLSLKFIAAFLLRGLLRDMHVRPPWPEVAAATWLLEPVGTEAALWPAALHVPLGLVCALAALRLYRRGATRWAAVASLFAALSVEQVIFALPLAAWLTAPRDRRWRAAVTSGAVMTIVVLAYATWPGANERQALTLAERLQAMLAKREWYLFFPMAGLGLYSGGLAFVWAFPSSVLVVLGGGLAGVLAAPSLVTKRGPGLEPTIAARTGAAVVVLIGLVNLPLAVTEVGYSARTFTPTWLVLSGVLGAGAAAVRWRHVRLAGAIAGACASIAILSLVLSVFVRVRTDQFNRAAARWIADRTRDGAVVAVCDVDRTVVTPAPLGAFHLHELHSEWGAWIEYHTGRIVQVRRSGLRYWGARCPDLRGADLIISFPQLVADLGRSSRPVTPERASRR